jgi:exodeoxyribonuclease VII small subunit
MATAAKPKKFEEELKDLEEIVGKIDSGELTLEDSIGAFERGVALVRSLNQKLDEIEKKVEVLSRNSQGDLRTAPYEGLEEENAAPPARRENSARDKGTADAIAPAKSAHDKNGGEKNSEDDDDIPF